MTTMLLSRPSLIVKNPALYMQVMCQHFAKNPATTLGQCVQKNEKDTPKQRGFENVVCFYFLQGSGLERAVLVTENMATRQIREGHFASCRGRNVP